MFADFKRNIKYLIDNVKQRHSSLTVNTIATYPQNKDFDYRGVTYVTVITMLNQGQIIIYNNI